MFEKLIFFNFIHFNSMQTLYFRRLLVVASIGFVLTILGCSNTNSSSTNVQTHTISGSLSTADSTGFTGRANPGSGIINGKIYVVDGMGASASVLNTLEVFDP